MNPPKMFDPDLPPNEPLWERLSELIQADDEEALSRLIAENRPYIGGCCLWSLVVEAADLGRVGVIGLLLKVCSEADIDAMNDGESSPLAAAAWYGHADIVRMLLAAGFDPNAAPNEYGSLGRPRISGRCALYCAMIGGYQDLVTLLEPLTSPAMRSMAYAAVELYHSLDSWGSP